MLAQHVVRHDPRSVTTAVLNQLVILLVQDTTINAVLLSWGMGKGVSLFLRLHAVWGNVMAINTAM